ncbi:MAG: helix-turn-helix domain-containing protein [Atopobiaceae bacterium]|nr:helix-turn-helix domain-containing protein [Atopobiaceae bacterium]MBR3315367.1 helix-turn-helix domain-containing protein [Atopobiaceae bacterium]
MNRVSKRFYTINDLVEMGFASRVKIWQLIKSGDLPAIKVGRSVRIPVDRFNRYCDTLLVVKNDDRSRC